MGSIQQRYLQTKIDELTRRMEGLSEKLGMLQPARDYETRPEEQWRMAHLIAEVEVERDRVAAELIKLEEALNAMSHPPKDDSQEQSHTSPRLRFPGPSLICPPSRPIDVFYSYSHKDEVLRERLETHLKLLKRQGIINDWHDRRISAGTEWEGQINQYLESAQIILLLISVDFLASDYCYDKEMRRALERHETGAARVIPIILRSVDMTGVPFSKLQALPRDAKPVDTWPNQDAAFTNIAQGIRQVALELAT
jgi:hypothetical protein